MPTLFSFFPIIFFIVLGFILSVLWYVALNYISNKVGLDMCFPGPEIDYKLEKYTAKQYCIALSICGAVIALFGALKTYVYYQNYSLALLIALLGGCIPITAIFIALLFLLIAIELRRFWQWFLLFFYKKN